MQRRNERNITQILLAAVILTVGVVVPLRAQTLNVIHNFVGSADGEYPVAGLTMDSAGTLYGTTAGLIYTSGPSYGSVFRLKLHNGSWLFTPLFDFRGGADGAYPLARVVIGPNGTLYGTANRGGIENCTQGCGLVFDLHPTPTIPASPLTPWREIVLYSFQGSTDGAYPGYGDMVFDSTGNMYNTSSQGGINACAGHVGCGVVYKLTKSGGTTPKPHSTLSAAARTGVSHRRGFLRQLQQPVHHGFQRRQWKQWHGHSADFRRQRKHNSSV